MAFRECLEVSLAAENRLAVVTAVDNVIDQSIGDGTQGAWHPQNPNMRGVSFDIRKF